MQGNHAAGWFCPASACFPPHVPPGNSMPAWYCCRFRCFVSSVVCLSLAVGCGESPQVRSYDVPRNPRLAESRAVERAGEATPTRMIAAIVPRKSQAWFVKVTGPERSVDEVADAVLAFVADIEPSANDPDAIEWSAPEAWKDGGERMMREATFVLPEGDPPLEVAISKLDFTGDREERLLANINRWRGQLGLPDVSVLDEAAGVTEIDLMGEPAWVLDAVGKASAASMTPPMMRGGTPFAGRSAMPPSSPPPATNTARPQLRFEPGDGWRELGRGAMGSRSFGLGEGDLQTVVKLSDFPPVGAMSDPRANIDRWRGQLGQPPLGDQKLEEVTEAVAIGEGDGVLTLITSPDDSQAMLVAMVVHLDHVWFFQLMGTPTSVAEHRDEFVEWLATVRMETGSDEKEGA